MHSLQELKPPKTLSLDVQQTIDIAQSSGGIVTQETIDMLVLMDEGKLTTEEAISQILKKAGLTRA